MAATHPAVIADLPRTAVTSFRPRDLSFEMQQLSARQLWHIFRRHLPLVAGIVGLCTLFVFTVESILPNTYEATATVQVEMNDATGGNQADATRNQQRVANEARIYQSQALAGQVVRDLHLDQNKVFTAPNPISSMIALVITPKPATPQSTTIKLINQTKVDSTTDSDFINIVVDSPTPQLSAQIANQYVQTLQRMRATRRQVWRDSLTKALVADRDRLADNVERAEAAVADYRRAHRMPVGAGGEEDYAQMNRVAVEAASAAALDSAAAQRQAGIDQAAALRTTAGATSPVLEALQRQYDDLQAQKSQLSTSLGANHPDMQRVDAQIAQVSHDLDRERSIVIANQQARNNSDGGREVALATGETKAAAARSGQLQSTLNALAGFAASNIRGNVDLNVLDRRADVARQAYLATAGRVQTVDATLDSTGVNSVMVSPASPPLLPIAPTPKKFAVAAFAGSLILALMIIFCIEMFDNKLRSPEQLRVLFGLRTLGMLPLLPRAIELAVESNPVVSEPESLFAEVARNLAADIKDGLPSGGLAKTVLITSPLPGDGKSSVAVTLASAVGALGYRAVVVDFDLRQPGPNVLRSIQNHSSTPDLIELLTSPQTMSALLPHAEIEAKTSSDELTPVTPVVLSTREPVANPAGLVRDQQIKDLLDTLRESFDLVIINAPAVLAVREARTLASIADATIMVVRWGHTSVDQMRASMDLLDDRVAGAVFNQVDYKKHARRGYGDAAQFYKGSSSYYSDAPSWRNWPERMRDRVRTTFTREAA